MYLCWCINDNWFRYFSHCNFITEIGIISVVLRKYIKIWTVNITSVICTFYIHKVKMRKLAWTWWYFHYIHSREHRISQPLCTYVYLYWYLNCCHWLTMNISIWFLVLQFKYEFNRHLKYWFFIVLKTSKKTINFGFG